MKMLCLLFIIFIADPTAYCAKELATEGKDVVNYKEELATEEKVVAWVPQGQMLKNNVKVGKHLIYSGAINGNYPMFALHFPAKNMTGNMTLRFFWRVNTSDPDWLPELRLSSADTKGFLYWRPPGKLHSGNLDWQNVQLKISDMKRSGKVNLKQISKIAFIGYHIINPDKEGTGFFIDGLRFERDSRRVTVLNNKKYSVYGAMHSDIPADVKHPLTLYKSADIERGKENIRRHAWARKLIDSEWIRKQVEFWMRIPDDKISYWIPEDGGYICYCPKCLVNGDIAWNGTGNDDANLLCSKCGFKFPSEQYKEDKFYDILTPAGKTKRVYYYEGRDQLIHKENIGNKYHLSSQLNWYKLKKLRFILNLAYFYALKGDVKYAAKVRKMLLRFAEVYPGYLPKWRATSHASYGLHPLAGKVHAWKLHDSYLMIDLALAYDLTCNSNLYSSEDRLKIENGIFREYKKLMFSVYPPLHDYATNAIIYHYTAGALTALLTNDKQFMSFLLGDTGVKHFIKRYFKRDGSWLEPSAAYNKMAIRPIFKFVDALRGYSLPSSRKGEKNVSKLNIFKQIPELKIIYKALAYATMPNGMLTPIADSDMAVRYNSQFAEINYKWDPSEENRRLLAFSLKGKEPNTFFSLFYMNPDFDFKQQTKPPWFVYSSLIIPGRRWAILRNGNTKNETALVLNYNGWVPHGHNDSLNFLFYNFNRELVTDLGYLSWANPLAIWLQAPLAHNLVVVDGKAPSDKRTTKLELFSGNYPVRALSAEAHNVYPEVKKYKRTMLMIGKTPEETYVLDLFQVKGGREHSYVFHADGEKIIPPKLDYKQTNPGAIGSPALGTKYISNIKRGKANGNFSCTWVSGKGAQQIKTTLHMVNDRADFIYFQAPGLRNRLTPLAKIKLFPVIWRRHAPESNFISLIDSYRNKAVIQKVVKLDTGDNKIIALKVKRGVYTDIICINTGRLKTIRLSACPKFKFFGKIAVVTLRNEKLHSLYMLGGSSLFWGNQKLIGKKLIQGRVRSFNQKTFKIKSNLARSPGFKAKGEYMIFPSMADGAYRIRKISKKGTITLNNNEVFKFKKGDAFVITPSYYVEIGEKK